MERFQHSLLITTLGFDVVGFALYMFLFRTSRERVEREPVGERHVRVAQLRECRHLRQERRALRSCLRHRAELSAPRLADLLALDDTGFREMFAGSPIKRIGIKRMIRNCLIAAGNSGDVGLVASVRRHLGDADPVIAEAASWALAQLLPRSAATQAA